MTIPAGEFWMGSDEQKDLNAGNWELPQHRLYLPEYRITRVPVTNIQYKQFVDATGYKPLYHYSGRQISDGKENHPVAGVTWHDVTAFCQWAGVRLPTEAEWEKAARGTDDRIWPWGDEPPSKAHCNFNMNVGDTTPVGAYAKGASPYGLLDMAGNVWEWTSSLYIAYPNKPDDGQGLPVVAREPVLRGGSFYASPYCLRCSYRYDFTFASYDEFGFRVARHEMARENWF